MGKSTVVIGLGNPNLGDDGVGWRVVENLQQILASSHPDVAYDCISVGGIHLMEKLAGYQRAILVDAVLTEGEVGQVHRYSLDDLPNGHSGDIHSASLQDALAAGRALGIDLPKEIIIVGMAIQPNLEFSDSLSPPVRGSLVLALKEVMSLL
jgi:hydrogenase maturation protease